MTTIISVRRFGKVVMAGDGQVSQGNTIMKGNAKKVQRIGGGKVLAGFAGATADAFTLMERFEGKLKESSGNLQRAVGPPVFGERDSRALRKLEAELAVADASESFIITGVGDVVRPENDIITMGSGGNYARAAATALFENTELSAEEIATKALAIAAGICVFTNSFKTVEIIDYSGSGDSH